MIANEEPLSAALRRTGWAAALGEREFAIAYQGVIERRYPAGGLVAAKGELSEHWFGVITGMVKVDSNLPDGKSTTFIGVSAGGWLGEGSLLKREPRPYEVIALQDTRMAFMAGGTFRWLYEHSLAFNHFLVTQLNARLGQFISIVERSRMHSTPELIAYGLATLIDPRPQPHAQDRICISQEELGKLCGVSRQVAARELHKLVEEGVISVEYGAIQVRDMQGLRSAAGM
jgi:CRP/FNR family transcriptional regulator, cyclic AMP receptor protein